MYAKSLVFMVLASALANQCAHAGEQPKTIRLGMASSFLTDRAKTEIDIASDDFNKVLTKTTGLVGNLTTKLTAAEVAEKLASKQLDFGIFYAHELAWAQKKHPDLVPLLVATNKRHVERAHLIVHKNGKVKSMADLRGKKLDLPIGTNEPCRLFLAKLCAQDSQKPPAAFFGSIQKSASQTEALDDVARGKVDATVVDAVFLEFYKEAKKAVFAKNLVVLQQSEVFPPAVIVYQKGAVGKATLDRFRDGLRKAHTIAEGQEMMRMWNVDAFELPPKDYATRLAEVLKAYPPPTSQR